MIDPSDENNIVDYLESLASGDQTSAIPLNTNILFIHILRQLWQIRITLLKHEARLDYLQTDRDFAVVRLRLIPSGIEG